MLRSSGGRGTVIKSGANHRGHTDHNEKSDLVKPYPMKRAPSTHLAP
jgi:hypothetical protein